MSGFLSLYGRRSLLLAPFTPGAEWKDLYLGLLTRFPDVSDDGTTVAEVAAMVMDPATYVTTDTGYARAHVPAMAGNDPLWTVVGGGTVAYTQSVRFPDALAPWGTLAAWGLFTQVSGGELIAAGPMADYVNGPVVEEGAEPDAPPPIGDTVVVAPFGMSFEVVSYV